MACTFQATIGGKFAPLIVLSDEDMDMDTIITTYNTAVIDAASEILGKESRRKKPWVTKDVGWLVGCFGFNGPLRQYFSLYRAVSQREGDR